MQVLTRVHLSTPVSRERGGGGEEWMRERKRRCRALISILILSSDKNKIHSMKSRKFTDETELAGQYSKLPVTQLLLPTPQADSLTPPRGTPSETESKVPLNFCE
ncbi:hypothetical protein BaRGS_00017234 [Batillaria attramentaria]|uniref:Uncharacterized protein n=1 Tax=Batillaria attramentaria TaxID=370345 RepID=A0ABD0KX18_9CAEN